MIVKIDEQYDVILTFSPINEITGHIFECFDYYLFLRNYFKVGILFLGSIGEEKLKNVFNDKYIINFDDIRDDIIISEYTEIPSIGYFDKKFVFPTVFENGVEWMAIKPNEIETMKQSISEACGNVLVYGLGLGYYAYMISLKNEVESITIIERDESVIKLFYEHILPQFEYKDKINVLKYDAFEYAENEAKKHNYNYAFVDLWHDVSDGTELYMKMKRLEKYLPKAKFSYWIEKSILSATRVRIFDTLYKSVKNGSLKQSISEIKEMLTDNFLRSLIKMDK